MIGFRYGSCIRYAPHCYSHCSQFGCNRSGCHANNRPDIRIRYSQIRNRFPRNIPRGVPSSRDAIRSVRGHSPSSQASTTLPHTARIPTRPAPSSTHLRRATSTSTRESRCSHRRGKAAGHTPAAEAEVAVRIRRADHRCRSPLIDLADIDLSHRRPAVRDRGQRCPAEERSRRAYSHRSLRSAPPRCPRELRLHPRGPAMDFDLGPARSNSRNSGYFYRQPHWPKPPQRTTQTIYIGETSSSLYLYGCLDAVRGAGFVPPVISVPSAADPVRLSRCYQTARRWRRDPRRRGASYWRAPGGRDCP
jgi:hypothetical protein